MSKKTKKTLAERLRAKKSEIKSKSQRSNIIRQKEEGTMRVRVLPVGEEKDFVMEIMQMWLGKDVGSSITPETFGEPCALMEAYRELKNSDDDADKEIAKKMMPKTRYVMPVLVYKDQKGKEVDEEQSGKLMQITGGLFQEIIDLYLDEDEWGDMTDPLKGYDLKITREGKGMLDTTYTVSPCKNTPLPKAWRKEVDLEAMVREEVDTYEQTVEKRDEFLGMGYTDEDEDEAQTKKKKRLKKKTSKTKEGTTKKKKIKRNRDI